MIIHLVRHAEAIERSPEFSEEQRFLTPRGRKRCRKISVAARKAGVDPDVIITSPLIRAVQTAEILAQALKFNGEVPISSLLAHGFGQEEMEKLIGGFPKAKEIALVGHEPELGLITEALMAAETHCALAKGAIVSFERSAETFTFKRMVDGDAKVTKSRRKALKILSKA